MCIRDCRFTRVACADYNYLSLLFEEEEEEVIAHNHSARA